MHSTSCKYRNTTPVEQTANYMLLQLLTPQATKNIEEETISNWPH